MFISIFLGPQGAGKDTQAKLLEKNGLAKAFSVGGVLRQVAKNNAEIKRYLNSGKLVPSDTLKFILRDLFKKHLENNGTSNLILTGFPRSISQIVVLDFLLKELNVGLYGVFYFKLSRELSVLRLKNRYICPVCGRIYNMVTNPPKYDTICDFDGAKLIKREDDDNEQVINNRLDLFYTKTLGVIKFFKRFGCVVEIDASKKVADIYKELHIFFIRQNILNCRYTSII